MVASRQSLSLGLGLLAWAHCYYYYGRYSTRPRTMPRRWVPDVTVGRILKVTVAYSILPKHPHSCMKLLCICSLTHTVGVEQPESRATRNKKAFHDQPAMRHKRPKAEARGTKRLEGRRWKATRHLHLPSCIDQGRVRGQLHTTGKWDHNGTENSWVLSFTSRHPPPRTIFFLPLTHRCTTSVPLFANEICWEIDGCIVLYCIVRVCIYSTDIITNTLKYGAT